MRLARQVSSFYELVNRHEQHVELQDHAIYESFKEDSLVYHHRQRISKLNSIMTNHILM
jgi:hypothetical protein